MSEMSTIAPIKESNIGEIRDENSVGYKKNPSKITVTTSDDEEIDICSNDFDGANKFTSSSSPTTASALLLSSNSTSFNSSQRIDQATAETRRQSTVCLSSASPFVVSPQTQNDDDCNANHANISSTYCLDSSSLSTDLSAATTSNNTSSALSLSCSSSGVGGISPLLIARPTQPKLSRKRSRLSLDSTNTTDDNESEDGDSQNASRKEKSLGLLCQKFLIAMGEEAQSGSDVHLETVAKKMTVEKRRIYDIVNVMEALEAMSKTNKSFYRWHGLDELPQLMALLQQQALSEGLPERIHRVERAMCSFTELSPASKRSGADIVGTLVSNKTTLNDSGCYFGVGLSSNNNNNNEEDCDSENDPRLESLSKAAQKSENRVLIKKFGSENNLSNPTSTSTKNSQQITRDRNAKNSLAQLCRRFLMVLLCNPKDRRRVSLDVASTVLIKDADSEGFEPPSRSRCRRLYDIANVLVAMGIIKKVHYLFGTKKIPLFVYCGPEPDAEKASAGRLDMLKASNVNENNLLTRRSLSEKTVLRSSENSCLSSASKSSSTRKYSKISKNETNSTEITEAPPLKRIGFSVLNNNNENGNVNVKISKLNAVNRNGSNLRRAISNNAILQQQRQQSAANQVEIARQKCDFDILVAASEQERRRLQEAISFGVATSSSKGCLAKRGPSQSRDLKSSEISHSILQSSSSSPVSASRSQISFSDSEMINDENIPPLIGFAASHTNLMLSPKSTASGVVPLVRTPSGAILVKPKAQFAKNSAVPMSVSGSGGGLSCAHLSMLNNNISQQQQSNVARKYCMMKLNGNERNILSGSNSSSSYQIHDPKQPHAFQKIEGGASASLAASAVIHRPDSVMSSAISTRSPFIAFNPIQPNSSGFHSQIHPSAIHHQIQHTAAAAAYSMSAILGTVNRAPPNAATMPQCHYRILSSPFHQPQHNDILKPLQTITAFDKPPATNRTILGELQPQQSVAALYHQQH